MKTAPGPARRESIARARAAGREARTSLPRSGFAALTLPERDPVGILEGQHATRLADLVPVRVGRMLETPFSFYRGAAAVMAHDVAGSPVTGHTLIASGDAHLANFGLFASPERRHTATERYYFQVDAEFLAARQSAARKRIRTEEKKARELQAQSDPFLGWIKDVPGEDGKPRDFYIRQFRDMKGSFTLEEMNAADQTEADHAALEQAVRSGRLPAEQGV